MTITTPGPGRVLGRSGIEVSDTFYGAGNIGGIGSAPATLGRGLTPEEGAAQLDRALARGVRVVDTADTYAGGTSETVVGAWAARHPDVLVTTKVGNPVGGRSTPDLSAERIATAVRTSLARLGRIDLYVTHAVDPDTPWARTVEALTRLVDGGTIRAFGCSNVGVDDLEQILEVVARSGLRRPEWVQNSFNLVDRRDEARLLPLLRAEGLGYTPFSPLAGGALSDRYLDGRGPEPGCRINLLGGEYGYATTPDALRRISALRDLAAEHATSTSGMALAWLLAHPDVTAPIVSPRTAAQWHALDDARRLPMIPDLHRRVGELFTR